MILVNGLKKIKRHDPERNIDLVIIATGWMALIAIIIIIFYS